MFGFRECTVFPKLLSLTGWSRAFRGPRQARFWLAGAEACGKPAMKCPALATEVKNCRTA